MAEDGDGRVSTEAASGTMEMAEVMRLLVEDRRSRERELREQMEMLQAMVEAGTRRDAAPGRASDDKVKLSKLAECDDIEAYLTTFERMMAAYEIPEGRWSFKLAPMLTGKAQQAYAAMEPARTAEYAQIKTAILRRYDISEETYRQRFRVAAKKDGETYRELATRVVDLLEKWTKTCTTVKAQARRQEEEAALLERREQESAVVPNPVEESIQLEPESSQDQEEERDGAGDEEQSQQEAGAWMPEFDEELFQGGKSNKKQTRSEKRQERQRYTVKKQVHPLDISVQELQQLQEADKTLETVQLAAGGTSTTAGKGFFKKDGLPQDETM